jgi:hypothetical protein
MDQMMRDSRQHACSGLFFAHHANGVEPLVVLECCRCGRLWHRRENGELVPYDRALKRLAQAARTESEPGAYSD